MRKSKLVLTILILIFLLSFPIAGVVGTEGLLFEDNFESYNVGDIPSQNWDILVSPFGYPYDQRVRSFEDNKVFSLFSERWAAVAFPKIGVQLNYAVEADAYMKPREEFGEGTTSGVSFWLRLRDSHTVHMRGGYRIRFDPSLDKVSILRFDWPNHDVIEEIDYELYLYTWYRFKASVSGDNYADGITIRAFVNDMNIPVLEVVDNDPTKWSGGMHGDQPGYTVVSGYHSRNYYDNVEIYEVPALLTIPVDIKPGSCPNPLNVKDKGVLPAAMLGTEDFDVTQIDLDSILLEGVPPLRSDLEDVATPYELYTGKENSSDCTDEGPDGFLDLTLKFDNQEIIQAIEEALERELEDGEVLVLTLKGNLKEEFGGTEIYGEDVIVIKKKGKK